jgi:hypothetical protein
VGHQLAIRPANGRRAANQHQFVLLPQPACPAGPERGGGVGRPGSEPSA